MNSTQTKTLLRIYQRPPRSDIRWKEVIARLESLDCDVTPGKGSHMRVVKRDETGDVVARMSFMKPHRPPHFARYALKDLREVLDAIDVGPETQKWATR